MKKKMKVIMILGLIMSMIQVPIFANAKSLVDAQRKANVSNMNKLSFTTNSLEIKHLAKDKDMSMDIVDIASSDGRFKTLVSALKAAGLIDTLKGTGPFTVFAPTDDAFSKLPAGTINELLKPENKKALANILTYHVTPGKVLAADALKLNGKEVTMVNGDKVKIEVKDNSVYINGAKVIVTDIMAKNGVIHVIDTVIMPPKNKI